MFETGHVPFTLPETYHGLAETEGLVWFENDALNMELETKDGILGLVRSGVKSFKIHLREIESTRFEKKLFRTRLTIQANSMAVLDGIPGTKPGEFQLRFKKKHREAAANLASALAYRLSEWRLEWLDQEMGKLE